MLPRAARGHRLYTFQSLRARGFAMIARPSAV